MNCIITTTNKKKVEQKDVEAFVTGALFMYYQRMEMSVDSNFRYYLIDTVDKTLKVITRGQSMDSTFSDIQCDIAIRANKVFN